MPHDSAKHAPWATKLAEIYFETLNRALLLGGLWFVAVHASTKLGLFVRAICIVGMMIYGFVLARDIATGIDLGLNPFAATLNARPNLRGVLYTLAIVINLVFFLAVVAATVEAIGVLGHGQP